MKHWSLYGRDQPRLLGSILGLVGLNKLSTSGVPPGTINHRHHIAKNNSYKISFGFFCLIIKDPNSIISNLKVV